LYRHFAIISSHAASLIGAAAAYIGLVGYLYNVTCRYQLLTGINGPLRMSSCLILNAPDAGMTDYTCMLSATVTTDMRANTEQRFYRAPHTMHTAGRPAP